MKLNVINSAFKLFLFFDYLYHGNVFANINICSRVEDPQLHLAPTSETKPTSLCISASVSFFNCLPIYFHFQALNII